MNHQQFQDIFRQIASEHVELQHNPDWKTDPDAGNMHFARVINSGMNPFDAHADIKEFISTYKDQLFYPCLLLESRSIKFKQPSSQENDNASAFYILAKVAEVNDFDGAETTVNICEIIAKEVLAWLKNESSKSPAPFWFNVETARLDPIGQLVDNTYGVRVELQLGVSEALKYDAARFDTDAFDYCEYSIMNLTPQQLNCFRVRVFNDEQGLEVFVPPGGEYEVQAGIYISATEPDPNVYPQWIELLV